MRQVYVKCYSMRVGASISLKYNTMSALLGWYQTRWGISSILYLPSSNDSFTYTQRRRKLMGSKHLFYGPTLKEWIEGNLNCSDSDCFVNFYDVSDALFLKWCLYAYATFFQHTTCRVHHNVIKKCCPSCSSESFEVISKFWLAVIPPRTSCRYAFILPAIISLVISKL